MFYISAQPAEQYFLWQLEIQLQNFEDMGILAENIHVLLAYNPKIGIPDNFRNFATINHQGQFFFYPDHRKKRNYLSSIRPHILVQHFREHPILTQQVICYHDSDILFRERLNESLLSSTPFWYFGDTRNYISYDYLARYGKEFLLNLCAAVDIDPAIVEKNKDHSGGAQHIMKGVDEIFWSEVEYYSEVIFDYMENFNKSIRNNTNKVQAWCADMWAVLWTAWKHNREVRLHNELNFSWPKEHISQYYKSKILHNSGVFDSDKTNYFCKLLFKVTDPYHLDFSKLKKDRCSMVYVEQINRISTKKQKPAINDCAIILLLRSAVTSQQQDKIENYINYLHKHLNVEIHIVERGDWPVFNQNLANGKAKYAFINNEKIDQFILKRIRKEFFIYVDVNILLPIENILSSFEMLKKNSNRIVLPMDQVIELSNTQYDLFRDTLARGLDRRDDSQEKKRIDYIESFAMSKQSFFKCGGNNIQWHFYQEDGFNLERQTRCRLMGMSIITIRKPAFKLFFWDFNIEIYRKNSLNRYLRATKATIDDVKRSIAHGSNSVTRGYGRKSTIKNLSFGICSLKENVDILHSLEELSRSEPVSITPIEVDHSNAFHLVFNQIITKSKRSKFDFVILINENLDFKKYNIDIFWRTVEEMSRYGLQMLSAISDRNYGKETIINARLFHVEYLPNSPFFLIHKSLFSKILSKSFNKDMRLEQYLNSLSEHVGMMVPFLGKLKMLNSESRDYQNTKDRMIHMENLEDELMWKLKNQ
ncbi:hypothetical protein HS960_09925 [Sphingobacterium paramultivorum]|uniref:Uncharacterized protein n=1 Tax=Sphingobacterium paramultivorum TaxID=2886510 RepID=A0A7G5E1T1_9SPHI|nr:hypothetical protein [Sphingobacterium paramultivorum]QMV67956.1 hypothetical protein HS960_09925 [Sphingobacterium paramultivorum]WSO16856.1 hypothetical protein VUL84_09915 [Sphingobacterium paramultivorum]